MHILNLLTIPALVFIYYFRKTEKVTFKGTVYATLIAGAILLFINNIIIPYTVYVGALVDLFFVNTLGLRVGHRSNIVGGYVQPVAEENVRVSSGSALFFENDPAKIDAEKAAETEQN